MEGLAGVLKQSDIEHLDELRTQTKEILRRAIGSAREVAVIDAPNQRNVGDSLIWEGELAYLKALGYRITYVCDLNGYDAADLRRKFKPGGVILLHGGGNFGDLWVWHQKLRERVVRDLPDYKIVQLSQSIFFANEDRAHDANRILGAHPDLEVLVRDTLSLERAKTLLPDVRCTFCPDMAFGYDPTHTNYTSENTVLVIARADKESASGLRDIPSDWAAPYEVKVTDWGLHAADPLAWRTARFMTMINHKIVAVRRKMKLPVPLIPQLIIRRLIVAINRRNVDSALKLYAQAQALVVDRLHAHVLSVLLGLDHVILDNNYRKIGGVFDDYSGVFSTANYSSDLSDAQMRTVKIVAG